MWGRLTFIIVDILLLFSSFELGIGFGLRLSGFELRPDLSIDLEAPSYNNISKAIAVNVGMALIIKQQKLKLLNHTNHLLRRRT